MSPIVNYPELVFVLSLVLLVASGWIGKVIGLRRKMAGAAIEDFRLVQGATLTLLGLIIGFSFSMAVNRYDQRKNYEEGEANAIGTEYLRADLLPAEQARTVRQLLKTYIDQRVNFYLSNEPDSRDAGSGPSQVQNELWSSVVRAAAAQPTPVLALTISGMNDVFNTKADTHAAWLNRIPTTAWALMLLIALFSNFLLGYRDRSSGSLPLVVLPVIASIAFFLIADIDSPYVGVISVVPQNLLSTSETMKP